MVVNMNVATIDLTGRHPGPAAPLHPARGTDLGGVETGTDPGRLRTNREMTCEILPN